jgi:hypothetical protein
MILANDHQRHHTQAWVDKLPMAPSRTWRTILRVIFRIESHVFDR